MNTNAGMFEEAINAEKQERKIKKLKDKIKDLININKEHQQINGKLRSELEIEKKNHDLVKEDNQLLNIEIGRMMKKLRN